VQAIKSVDEFAEKVVNNGGEVIKEKQTIPGVGYIIICKDTEKNIIGLLQIDMLVK